MMPSVLPARRLYRLLLAAYPPPDTQCAREMEELFEDLHREARAQSGRIAAWRLVLRAYGDALTHGLRARYRKRRSGANGGGQQRPSRGRRGFSRSRLVENAILDLRYALRSFVATPAVTVVAIVVFALGIGANTAVFSVVEATLLRPLPFAAPERLVDITDLPPQMFERNEPVAGGGLVKLSVYRAWQQRARLLDDMAVYTSTQPVLTGLGEPEEVRAYPVESNLFALLGARPLLGRGFSGEEDRRGTARVVVLSHAFWSSRLGRDPGAIGRTLTLDGEPHEIVGVMPRGFRFPTFSDPARATMWVPLGLGIERLESPNNSQGSCWVVGRLQDGASPAQAKVELDRILEELERSGDREPRRSDWRANLTPLHAWVAEDIRQPLFLLLGAVGLVFAVACSNVANLLLARGTSREREMSIRVAVGAGSTRLMGQALIESLLLAATGGLIGILAAYWMVPLILALGGSVIPRINDIGINTSVLAATLAGTALAGVLAGSVPALRVGRRARTGSLLVAGQGAGESRRLGRATGALVVAQVALTLMLLAGAGLLARSLIGLLRVELGFETEYILVSEVELPSWLYPDAASRLDYANRLLEQASGTPGVLEVAVSSFSPFENGIISSVSIPDAPELEGLPWTIVNATTPDYFRVVGIPLLRGDIYADAAPTPGPVAVIDLAAVEAYFPGQDPIGRQIATYRWRDEPLTIIGVVGNVREGALRREPPPHVYVPVRSSPDRYLRVLARTAGDTSEVAAMLRDAVREVDPFVPIERVVPLQALVTESLEEERFYTSLLGGFAAAGILMAAAGIFGVMRFAVSRRVQELGIRVALGARAVDILAMVIGRGLGLAAIGILSGALGAAGTTRFLSSFLYGVSALDPLTFVLAGILLAVLSVSASAFPAWRAARVDPVRSLRAE